MNDGEPLTAYRREQARPKSTNLASSIAAFLLISLGGSRGSLSPYITALQRRGPKRDDWGVRRSSAPNRSYLAPLALYRPALLRTTFVGRESKWGRESILRC